MRTRALDAGGSVTRNARSKKEIFQVPSTCMEIPASSPSKGHILDNKLVDFIIRKSPCTVLEGRRFVRGDGMNQYTGDIMVCNNTEVKVLQEITYINIIYSLAADCQRRGINDQDFKIAVCIPAAEYYDDVNDRIAEVKNNLAGDHAVYFPMLDTTIRFSIDKKNIGVVAEGVVAAFAFRTDRKFVTKNTVIIDVGYRSTDVTILLQFKPVGKSAASRPIGGINLEAAIQSQLERDNIFVSTEVVQRALSSVYVVNDAYTDLTDVTKYVEEARKDNKNGNYIEDALMLLEMDGYNVSADQLKVAVRSHYILQGLEVKDITSYVHDAKDTFVDELYRVVQNVANAKMMNVGDISNALCIGRPFSGDADDPYCMVNLLSKKFKDEVSMYVVPDSGVANVVEMIKLLGEDDDV